MKFPFGFLIKSKGFKVYVALLVIMVEGNRVKTAFIAAGGSKKIKDQPRELLKLIPGLNLIEMRNSDRCCGAGGTYVITQHQMSLKLMEDKMDAIVETNADIVTTANPGCWLQMNQGSRKTNMPVKVKYVTDLLDESYRAERIENEPETKSTPVNVSAWEEERLELRSQWENRTSDRRKRRDR